MTSLFNFRAFPLLMTERLILRELTRDDTESVFAIRGDPEVTRLNTGKPYTQPQQAALLIDHINRDYREKLSIRWGICLREERRVIGLCGYNFWLRSERRASVGYDLARAYWGRGIMSEALGAVVAFGFLRMGLTRIEADAHQDNFASMRVLEKVGFRRYGVEIEADENGAMFNLVLFAMTRGDFDKKQEEESWAGQS